MNALLMRNMNFEETKEMIIERLKHYKEDDINIHKNYEWEHLGGVNEFLMEHTNREYSLDEYFYVWDFNYEIVFECIEYINTEYYNEYGDDLKVDYIQSLKQVMNQLIYWVGQEIAEDLLEERETDNEEDSDDEDSDDEDDIILEKFIPDYVIAPQVA
jgi:hypothetical protein